MWKRGRQGTGYFKKNIFHSNFCDLLWIFYPKETFIPTHQDKIDGKKHFRLNIRMYGPDSYHGNYLFKWKRIVLFRPDIMPYSVERVAEKRLILSFGLAI